MRTAAINCADILLSHDHEGRSWFSRTAFILLIGLIVLFAQDVVQRRDSAPPITFENAPAEVTEDGPRIIAETIQRFEQLMRRKVGNLPVLIRFVERVELDKTGETGTTHVQGYTFYGEDSCVIHISARRTSSWGRILVHEITHVFVREAYGRAMNRTLNEGLAEYLAEQAFPYEVRRDRRNASHGSISAALSPYIEGHRFISEHISDKRFADFFAAEIRNRFSSYGLLKQAWKEQPPF